MKIALQPPTASQVQLEPDLQQFLLSVFCSQAAAMSSIETILKSETSAEALTSALDGQEWLFADPDLSKDSAGVRTACMQHWQVLAKLVECFFGWNNKTAIPWSASSQCSTQGPIVSS